ncbi:MAG: hypothetical protein PHE60_04120 [Sulfurospirillaceae bacterium]|nr:hypothetical protein [Sulfurospirillaceae bacterium]
MRSIVFCILCIVLMSGCSVKKEALNTEPTKFEALTHDIMALGKKVDEKEAKMFAKEALSYPRVLAEKYDLMAPANFQNMLINLGFRERGLCYQWTEDMITHLKKQNYRSFDLRWGVAFKGEPMEHNSVVVVVKGAPFESGILIDPWRNSGELYWGKMEDDFIFRWVENMERSRYYGTIKASSK